MLNNLNAQANLLSLSWVMMIYVKRMLWAVICDTPN